MSTFGAQEEAGSTQPRRFTRYPADIRIDAEVFRPSGTVSLWGRSSEIGEDGIGGTLTEEVQPGEVVSMEITLPMTNHSMRFRALVRYRIGLRHGFEFLALTQEQRDHLRRLCEVLASTL
ncbi:MAG TPA: PilZ domain-containing protein [Terriglobales bacterium]|nr:PilZ domain-containing protein [Terriglobales bacterium]